MTPAVVRTDLTKHKLVGLYELAQIEGVLLPEEDAATPSNNLETPGI